VTTTTSSPAMLDSDDYLLGLQSIEHSRSRSKPSLDTMRRLMDALGDPARRLRAVHITGTNGKGSTAAICAELLAASNLDVGLFTGPHLSRAYERIAVNGVAISDADLSSALYRVRRAGLTASVQPTWFEAMTAAALVHFDRCRVGAAVIEVGMLGRWDATNVIDAEVAVVTNIGWDHIELAGPGREFIAYENAGIVRAGSTLVLGERDPSIRNYFEQQLPDRILLLDRDISVVAKTASSPLTGDSDYITPWACHNDMDLKPAGDFQRHNALCALAAAEAFLQRPMDSRVIREVFGAVSLPGRFEVLHATPLIVADCAHNEAAALALRPLVDSTVKRAGRRVLLCGLTIGSDPRQFLANLGADRFDHIVVTEPDTPRAQSCAALAESAATFDVTVVSEPAISTALQVSTSLAGTSGLVLVTGSHYLVGPVRDLVRPASE
jgi:dihydrofolate synthase / folylpolyglutamate synthase